MRARTAIISTAAALMLGNSGAVSGQSRRETPEDVARVTVQVCVREEPQLRARLRREQSGGEAIFERLKYREYCQCIGDGIAGHITQEMLDSRNVPDPDTLVQTLANSCMQGTLRRLFSEEACPDLARTIGTTRGKMPTPSEISDGCRCLKTSLDKVAPSDLLPAITAVGKNINDVQKHGRLLTPPSPLLLDLKACLEVAPENR